VIEIQKDEKMRKSKKFLHKSRFRLWFRNGIGSWL